MAERFPVSGKHTTIKEVVNTFPAAPGMYVEIGNTSPSYVLVVAWAEVIDHDDKTRVIGLTLTDIGKPHTEWPIYLRLTSQPDRNAGTIVR